MSATLQSLSLQAQMAFNQTSVKTYGGPTWGQNRTSPFTWTIGTAVDAIDMVYVTEGTLAGSGNADIDLTGSLVDEFGNALNFARVKVIYVEAKKKSPSPSSIQVGGGGANPVVTWVVPLAPSTANPGLFLLVRPDATGIVVSNAAADIFRIHNNDGVNSADYWAFFAGCSA